MMHPFLSATSASTARLLGSNITRSNVNHFMLKQHASLVPSINRNSSPPCAVVNDGQKRSFETTESKINIAHTVNATRKLLYGNPLVLQKKKAKLAKKGIYRLKNKRKPWVWPKGKKRADVMEENRAKNPPGTVKEQRVSEADQSFIQAIKECAQEPGRMEDAVQYYHLMRIRPDTHTYLDLLNVFLINSTADNVYLGEALQIYQDIRHHEIQPTVEIYSVLMQLCLMRKHLPRGIFIFKEFLSHIKMPKARGRTWEKKKDRYVEFHKLLLRLCYECESPDRAAAVFDHMLRRYSHVICHMSGSTRASRNPTVDFVKCFVEDEEKAASFAYRMRESLKGHVIPENAKPDEIADYASMTEAQLLSAIGNNTALSPSMRTAFASMAMTDDPYDDDANRGVFESTLDEAPIIHQFSMFHESDPSISKIHLELKRNIYEVAREVFNDYVNGTPQKEKLTGVTEEESDLLLMGIQEETQFKLNEAIEFEQAREIHEEYLKKKRHIQNRLQTRLNWKPVIVGVDGLPFFPTCIDATRITGESVRAAKQEYMDSIEDPQVRGDIEREFSDRVKLCWFDVDKGELIEGLYH